MLPKRWPLLAQPVHTLSAQHYSATRVQQCLCMIVVFVWERVVDYPKPAVAVTGRTFTVGTANAWWSTGVDPGGGGWMWRVHPLLFSATENTQTTKVIVGKPGVLFMVGHDLLLISLMLFRGRPCSLSHPHSALLASMIGHPPLLVIPGYAPSQNLMFKGKLWHGSCLPVHLSAWTAMSIVHCRGTACDQSGCHQDCNILRGMMVSTLSFYDGWWRKIGKNASPFLPPVGGKSGPKTMLFQDTVQHIMFLRSEHGWWKLQ